MSALAPSPLIGLVVFVLLGSCALLGYLLGQRARPRTVAEGPLPAARVARPARDSASAREVEELRQQLAILSSSALGVAERVDRLARDMQRLDGRVGEAELDAANGGASYVPAIKMAERGCAVEELIEHFGLPLGEAELLSKLHGANSAAYEPSPRRVGRAD